MPSETQEAVTVPLPCPFCGAAMHFSPHQPLPSTAANRIAVQHPWDGACILRGQSFVLSQWNRRAASTERTPADTKRLDWLGKFATISAHDAVGRVMFSNHWPEDTRSLREAVDAAMGESRVPVPTTPTYCTCATASGIHTNTCASRIPSPEPSATGTPTVATLPGGGARGGEVHPKTRDKEGGEFHQRDGWYFTRMPNGDVRIRYFTFDFAVGHVIPVIEWVSVVTHLTADQEYNFAAFEQMHMGRPATDATRSETTKCARCGADDDGWGRVFTICSPCWDVEHPKPSRPSVSESEATPVELRADTETLCAALYALYEDWGANAYAKATSTQAVDVLNIRQALIDGMLVRRAAGEPTATEELLKEANIAASTLGTNRPDLIRRLASEVRRLSSQLEEAQNSNEMLKDTVVRLTDGWTEANKKLGRLNSEKQALVEGKVYRASWRGLNAVIGQSEWRVGGTSINNDPEFPTDQAALDAYLSKNEGPHATEPEAAVTRIAQLENSAQASLLSLKEKVEAMDCGCESCFHFGRSVHPRTSEWQIDRAAVLSLIQSHIDSSGEEKP